jgi:hypothetical protein
MIARCSIAVVAAVLFTALPVSAQTSYPMLMSLKPTAAQVGQTSEHTVNSRYTMHGACQVLVSGQGVTGEVVPPETKEEPAKDDKEAAEKAEKEKEKKERPNIQNLKVRFTVAEDALPGVRDFRIVTPTGASTVGQLVIVRDPVVSEEAKNDTTEQAQAVTLPATICGAIEKAEDVDCFKFSVEAGQAYSFHVRAMRLEDRIHDLQEHIDPILTLRSSTGGTLAASDNVFAGDPLLAYRFEQAGEYVLEIRDVRYKGNTYWEYCIEASRQPLVITAQPLAVTAGQTARLELFGHNVPAEPVEVAIPADAPAGPYVVARPLSDVASSPVELEVTNLPLHLETDDAGGEPASAQTIAVPQAVSGRIGAESDVDCYVLDAKKGDIYFIEMQARRLQSRLDAHLRVLDEKGKQLALNDDYQFGRRSSADARIESWTAPADGKFIVEVRDLHLRGGPDYPYVLTIDRAQPHFLLLLDTDKTQLTPGTAGVIYARVDRKNGFTGEVQLHVEGLPAGVIAQCGRILAGKGQDGCIILEAAADAPLAAANIRVWGEAALQEGEATRQLSAEAIIYQETYMPGGGRGHWPVEMHTVAVGEPIDLRAVKLNTYELTLKPGESKKIEIAIERAEGFDKNVTLDVIFKHLNSTYGDSLPEGVTVDQKNSKTLLTGNETTGLITLTAAANAPPVDRQQIAVTASVSINFVMKATYAAAPLSVTVSE